MATEMPVMLNGKQVGMGVVDDDGSVEFTFTTESRHYFVTDHIDSKFSITEVSIDGSDVNGV